jgi:hypothetical protein
MVARIAELPCDRRSLKYANAAALEQRQCQQCDVKQRQRRLAVAQMGEGTGSNFEEKAQALKKTSPADFTSRHSVALKRTFEIDIVLSRLYNRNGITIGHDGGGYVSAWRPRSLGLALSFSQRNANFAFDV